MAITVNATQQIQNYTSAPSTDATNDYFLGYNNAAGAYRKYNRNLLLGITGLPVGTTDAQTLTSKTLTSPTINGATLSGTLSGTYTLGGTPTFPASVVTLTGTQTLTNKTLTSPVISGGTISNASISVDSISGFTTSTVVTVGGVQMNNGVLNTSNAVTSASIAIGAVQPQALVSGTGTGWAWSSWTPTFTILTVGNGTVVARYIQIGKTVSGFISITLGSSSSVGSGTITFTAPVTMHSSWTPATTTPQIGIARNTGNGANFADIPIRAESTTLFDFIVPTASGSYVGETTFSSTIPSTWSSGTSLAGTFSYEAA